MTEKTTAVSESRWRKWAALGLGLCVSGVFVFLTFRKIETSELVEHIRKVSLPILSLSIVTKMFGFMAVTTRSQVLFEHIERIPFPRMLKSVLVAFAGNNLLPFRAGEFARIGYLTRNGRELTPTACIGVIALERLLDLFILSLLFLSLLLFAFVDIADLTVSNSHLVFAMCGLFVVFVLLAVGVGRRPDHFVEIVDKVGVLFGKRIGNLLNAKSKQFARGLAGVSSLPKLLWVIGLTTLYWFSGIGSVAIWCWAFGFELPWHAPLVVSVFSAFATILPSSPGYIGTYHYFVKHALELFGIGAASAASFAVVGHATAMVPFTLVAIAVLLGDYMRETNQ